MYGFIKRLEVVSVRIFGLIRIENLLEQKRNRRGKGKRKHETFPICRSPHVSGSH